MGVYLVWVIGVVGGENGVDCRGIGLYGLIFGVCRYIVLVEEIIYYLLKAWIGDGG